MDSGTVRQLRVLLIEDDDAHALLAEEALSGRDVAFACTRAATLEESRQILRDQKFDVVLLDLNLPDSTGPETIGEVRELSNTPVVILTALDSFSVAEIASDHGASAYLVKDQWTPGALQRTIVMAARQGFRSPDVPISDFSPGLRPVMVTSKQRRDWLNRRLQAATASKMPVVLVSLNQPAELLEAVLEEHEGLYVVDATERGSEPLPRSDRVRAVGAPTRLEIVAMACFAKLNGTKGHLIVDSLNTVALYNGEATSLQFIDRLRHAAQQRGNSVDVLFITGETGEALLKLCAPLLVDAEAPLALAD